jgi:maltooligosyltrehalose trehalohydrolase
MERQGQQIPLLSETGGWWRLPSEKPLEHGEDYAFYVDGAGPFPDPRSRWQPEGVHGPSRHFDPTRFNWTDQGWRPLPLSAAIIYELHIGTFTAAGTFAAAIERLDELVELGITHVELMPVASFPGVQGWGYDGVSLYAPHQPYGGPAGLQQLVDACHQRGLAVLLDVVYNHLGPSGNYLDRFGPYFTDRYTTPWGDAVNFDGPGSDEVRRFFIDNALMWLRDYHFDGLRIDAVHAIIDTSAIHFLEQLANEVAELEGVLGRQPILIAESDLNQPRIVEPPSSGGYGLDAQWNEDFHHALHACLTGEDNGYYRDFGELAELARVLTEGFAYAGRYSAYRQRYHGRSARHLSGRQLVACLQNHDQIGNRALGERTSQLLSPEQLKVGAALVLLGPFVPLLFQGEEWGAGSPFLYFTDHQEAELGEAVRQGRQREFAAFGWDPAEIPDPQARRSFVRSKLDWQEKNRDRHAELLAWHRSLIEVRRHSAALTDGNLRAVQVSYDEEQRYLLLSRGAFCIVCNFAPHPRRIPLAGAEQLQIILASCEAIKLVAGQLDMPTSGVAILESR